MSQIEDAYFKVMLTDILNLHAAKEVDLLKAQDERLKASRRQTSTQADRVADFLTILGPACLVSLATWLLVDEVRVIPSLKQRIRSLERQS